MLQGGSCRGQLLLQLLDPSGLQLQRSVSICRFCSGLCIAKVNVVLAIPYSMTTVMW